MIIARQRKKLAEEESNVMLAIDEELGELRGIFEVMVNVAGVQCGVSGVSGVCG